jgi:hypothetical protein
MRLSCCVAACLSILMVVGCGNGNSQGDVVSGPDLADVPLDGNDTSGEGDICLPACEGQVCGSDGCGGSCGACDSLAWCNDSGTCEEIACQSSKDCPGELVCTAELGLCVACVGDEDCVEDGAFCGADYACHTVSSCKSDKDCKELAQVCDKDAGACVDCNFSSDCAGALVCVEGYCVSGLCNPGDMICADEDLMACSEAGDDWVFSEACGPAQYCESEECHDFLCPEGKVWCDGDVYKVCSADGKSLQFEEDCSLKDQHCFAGACLDSICEPEAKFCTGNSTAAFCSEDGLSMTEAECPAQQYCEDGACFPWICDPGFAVCNLFVAELCNLTGDGFVSQTDCEALGQVCLGGQCSDLLCAPNSSTCKDDTTAKHCSADGKGFEEEVCADLHSCKDGECKGWVCMPGDPICNDTVATVCDALGLGPAAGGTDCSDSGSKCEWGVCAECEPQCEGIDCGDDECGGSCGSCGDAEECFLGACVSVGSFCDDGNDEAWDGCTDGMLSEFTVQQSGSGLNWPRVAAAPNGSFGVAWGGTDSDSGGVLYRIFGSDGQPLSDQSIANVFTVGSQSFPGIAALNDDRMVIVWSSANQDGDGTGIFGRVFNVDGSPSTEEFGVNSATVNHQNYPAISAGAENGNYVVVWETKNALGGALYNLAGMKLLEFNPASGQAGQTKIRPSVSMFADGSFVVAWQWMSTVSKDKYDIVMRTFDSSGLPTSSPSAVNTYKLNYQEYPSVAALSDGNFVVVWQSADLDGSGLGVYGILLGGDGEVVKEDFKVHTDNYSNQDFAEVAALADGGFVVVYDSPADGDGGGGIFGQRFDAEGSKIGGESHLNMKTELAQRYGVASGFAAGGFVATWVDHIYNGNNGYGISARRFNGAGEPIYH